MTPTILNYFVEHKNSKDVKYSKTFDFKYLSLRLNRETGKIYNFNHDMLDNDELMDSTSELVLPIDNTNKILDEINRLTNNKF